MDLQEEISQYKGWRHSIEVAPGVFTPGLHKMAGKLSLTELPERLDGKRILDVGASDGFFSFECEKRGAAEVVAMDVRKPLGFSIAKNILESKVQYVEGSLYEEDPGKFDLVLCLNVLYHVRHVFLALEKLYNFCGGEIILSTIATDEYYLRDDGSSVPLHTLSPDLRDAAIAQFLQTNPAYSGKPSYWSVSSKALTGMMESVGFKIKRYKLHGKNRVYVWAHV